MSENTQISRSYLRAQLQLRMSRICNGLRLPDLMAMKILKRERFAWTFSAGLWHGWPPVGDPGCLIVFYRGMYFCSWLESVLVFHPVLTGRVAGVCVCASARWFSGVPLAPAPLGSLRSRKPCAFRRP